MSMFSKHLKRMVIIMFIVYRGLSDPYEPVTNGIFMLIANLRTTIYKMVRMITLETQHQRMNM
jgi:hypothetical protein